MSLDVYLTLPNEAVRLPRIKGSGIFIRENGTIREITREEWDSRYPGREPITIEPHERQDGSICVYSSNITHNLNEMAEVAGIYKPLWRPDEIGISKAHQLILPLTVGLEALRNGPEGFKLFNPSNGWGTYEALVQFVDGYLQACTQFPDADVSIWR